MTVRLVKQLVFGCAVVVVGGLSLLPQEVLPETGVWDKLEHTVAYAALCVIGAIAYPRKLARSKLLLGLVLYGVALEALQSFLPGRVGFMKLRRIIRSGDDTCMAVSADDDVGRCRDLSIGPALDRRRGGGLAKTGCSNGHGGESRDDPRRLYAHQPITSEYRSEDRRGHGGLLGISVQPAAAQSSP